MHVLRRYKRCLFGDNFVLSEWITAAFANGGKRFRNGSDVFYNADLKDVVFREKGACVLSFALRNPASIVGGAAGLSRPIEHARVTPIVPSTDRRLPSQKVPACVKWFNDELDETPLMTCLSNVGPLTGDLDNAQNAVIHEMRALPSRSIESLVELAVSENINNSADDWGVLHVRGITHLVYTMEILLWNIYIGFSSITF